MNAAPARRGQPVAMLGLLLAGWVAARAVIVAAVPDSAGLVWQLGGIDGLPSSPALPGGDRPGLLPPEAPLVAAAGSHDLTPAETVRPPLLPFAAPAHLAETPDAPPAPPTQAPRPHTAFEPVPAPIAAGHLMLWMAGIARLAENGIGLPPRDDAPVVERPGSITSRWSGDGWLLLRRGGAPGLAAGAGLATYGASQAGAVIRYRLVPSSPLRPAAYLRATAALGQVHDRELAAGLSARPLARLPVTVAAEVRLADRAGPSRLRPAVLAYTELPAFALPAGLRGETYAQAGYVGGSNATAFADGQLRVDRHLTGAGPAEVRGGGGVWGGIQKGAARLDVGPGVSLGLPMGSSASARLALDWRFRVAGDARPGPGPALTLSAGF